MSEAEDDGGASATTITARRSGVVVFVKDQHRRRHQRCVTGAELGTDSASNTDSGNGTSEYSDEPSPPLIVSPAAASAAARRHHTAIADSHSTALSLFQL